MIGAMVAVAALAGALTFGTSLGQLVNNPGQQGWNWDVVVGNPHDLSDREAQAGTLLAHNHLVGSYSAIAILAGAGQGNAYIGGVPLDTLLAVDPLKGAVYPPLLEGRPPRASREIVLGSHTLHRLHHEPTVSGRPNGIAPRHKGPRSIQPDPASHGGPERG